MIQPLPKKVTISKKRIAWSAWEIHQWIEAKLASREQGADAPYLFNLIIFLIKNIKCKPIQGLDENKQYKVIGFSL